MPAVAMEISALGTRVPTFFIRDMPASRQSRPASMSSTSTAAIVTHRVLMATVSPSTPLPAASSESAIALAGSASATRVAPANAGAVLRFIVHPPLGQERHEACPREARGPISRRSEPGAGDVYAV